MSKNKATNVNTRAGMDKDSLREDIKLHLRHTLAKDEYSTTNWDRYKSVTLTIMYRLNDH